MPKNLFNRYLWLVDTIRRYGRITRRELDEAWIRSPYSDGRKMLRRTFYNYRQAVEELFDINIQCDPTTFQYYIEDQNPGEHNITDWLMNSAAVNDVLGNARSIADRVFLEDVPSARHFLGDIIEAMRKNHPIQFSYHPYTRTLPTDGVVVEPYFLKIFKNRWYVTGRHVAQNRIKTYALDRMSDLQLLNREFTLPAGFDAAEYFRDSFGIMFTQSEPRRVALRAEPRQAKYIRALPLHPSQMEMMHDDYSIFYYTMRISPDLVEEILSHGPRLTVLEPPELRAMVMEELQKALDNY